MFSDLQCPICPSGTIVRVEVVHERRTYAIFASMFAPGTIVVDDEAPTVEQTAQPQTYFLCEHCNWTHHTTSADELLKHLAQIARTGTTSNSEGPEPVTCAGGRGESRVPVSA